MSGNVIAKRQFSVGLNTAQRVEVSVFQPIEDNGDYKCQYEIRENDKVAHQSHAMGVDSLQAIILAIRKLGADITFSDYAKSGRLYWNGQNDDLGLPLPK